MGILNVTPDSFYDGGKFLSLTSALKQVEKLISEGADIVDIGGESSRPGTKPIPVEEELSRVIPVIKEIKKRFKVTLSIDSYKYEVVKQSLENGVEIINDIYSLRYSPEIVSLLKQFPKTKIILMHMQGNPTTMQINPRYKNVVDEIKNFFKERVKYLNSHGINNNRIILDPGIGFGKTTKHNLEILKNLERFKILKGKQFPLLIGLSRKSFIGRILGSEEKPLPPEDRYEGTIILHTYALLKNVDIIRTHDVKPVAHAIKLLKHL
ncbi:MAG: dihydropteroate synthase [Endomicrobiia bacterium]